MCMGFVFVDDTHLIVRGTEDETNTTSLQEEKTNALPPRQVQKQVKP